MSSTRTGNNGTTNGNGGKTNKFANAGAAAGGFVGAMGGSFVPPINITVNRAQSNGARGGGKFTLPEPNFDSTEDIRNYCNHVRALMISCAIELAVAGKILEARLAQVPPKEDENPIQARIRAKRVARKFQRAAGSATAVARNIVGAESIYRREYAHVISPRPQQGATTRPFSF